MDEPGSSPQSLFSDRVKINGSSLTAALTLTAEGNLRWTDGKDQQRWLVLEKEVLGFSVVDGTKIALKTVVHSEAACCCCCIGGSRGDQLVRKDFVFEPVNGDSLNLWRQCIGDYLDSLGRPKRLLVFVNPYGGKRIAPKVYYDHVKPLLEDAGVQITLQETEHRLHAKEVVSSLELSKYDGIVCVSGDGILVEVVNGLLERQDWKDAIKMPLGIVPAGTSNGMVKSLLDAAGEPCTPENAVLAVIRGRKTSLDVATVLQGDTKYYSVLMLAWGLVADIDIESEKYRWMGSSRIDFYAIQRLFSLRQYNGRISFVPAPGFESYGEPFNHNSGLTSHEKLVKVQPYGYHGPDLELLNREWRTIDGPFTSVWLHNVAWGGENTMAAPDAKFSDGCLDLVLIKDCPRLALLSFMTELSNGGHVKSPHVMYLKVKAFILEPGPRVKEPSVGGIIDVDGEVLARGNGTYKFEEETLMAYDRLLITVNQGLATIFSPV
ncbi:Sphingosine kinase 1 [Linum grandiflorum]